MNQHRKARIHAQTLAEMNHCVGTARRDAAYMRLCELAGGEGWPEGSAERKAFYAECLALVREVLETTRRSSLMFSDPGQEVYDRPLLHFLHLTDELFQTVSLLAEHVHTVRSEAEVLSEHLGAEAYSNLENNCADFERHERMAQGTLTGTLLVGQTLLKADTERRRQMFSEDDCRRYDKAFAEYVRYYKEMGGE